MRPLPIYRWINTANVRVVLGAEPRVYPFGSAPHGLGLARPYAVYHLVSGSPEHCLSGDISTGTQRLQFDVWAKHSGDAQEAAAAIRNELKKHGYTVSHGPDFRDPDTLDYCVRFDMEFWHDGY